MKRIIDVCMTILLLFLMAYQVTGEVLHEWIGIGMTVLVIVHQILNRKWYGALCDILPPLVEVGASRSTSLTA